MKLLNKLFSIKSSVLCDRDIREFILDGQLVKVEPTELGSNIQPNSYDLTLSDSVSVLKPNSVTDEGVQCINSKVDMEYDQFDVTDKIIIQPKSFLLLSTNEVVDIPNGILGIVCGRSSVARMGIQVEQAGLLDSGFTGNVTLEVYNQTEYPIVLYPGQRIAQVYFLRSSFCDKVYGEKEGSKYQNQTGATASRMSEDI